MSYKDLFCESVIKGFGITLGVFTSILTVSPIVRSMFKEDTKQTDKKDTKDTQSNSKSSTSTPKSNTTKPITTRHHLEITKKDVSNSSEYKDLFNKL